RQGTSNEAVRVSAKSQSLLRDFSSKNDGLFFGRTAVHCGILELRDFVVKKLFGFLGRHTDSQRRSHSSARKCPLQHSASGIQCRGDFLDGLFLIILILDRQRFVVSIWGRIERRSGLDFL
ncbi:hypothetical protein, partial [Sutterella massiliensis]|uniref:hypothetical protein n=1 Tax=Sutterella massiliensis TaxID=1816689 RepID=UPI0019619F36